jgi:hypothetical protein
VERVLLAGKPKQLNRSSLPQLDKAEYSPALPVSSRASRASDAARPARSRVPCSRVSNLPRRNNSRSLQAIKQEFRNPVLLASNSVLVLNGPWSLANSRALLYSSAMPLVSPRELGATKRNAMVLLQMLVGQSIGQNLPIRTSPLLECSVTRVSSLHRTDKPVLLVS